MVLSSEEKELLIAAHKSSGELNLISFSKDELNPFIKIGEEETFFPIGNDPTESATYMEAIESLHKRGYIRKESEEPKKFMLTASGFKIARELAEEEQ